MHAYNQASEKEAAFGTCLPMMHQRDFHWLMKNFIYLFSRVDCRYKGVTLFIIARIIRILTVSSRSKHQINYQQGREKTRSRILYIASTINYVGVSMCARASSHLTSPRTN